MRKQLLTALVLGGSVAMTGAALADPINIWIGVPGNAALVTANGSGTATIASTTISTLTVQASATGSPILPQPQLTSNTIDIKNSSALTIDVWVWETSITGPLGSYNMLSGFTSNLVTNATVVESTYVSTSNNSVTGTGTFAGTLLASQSFTGNGGVTDIDATPNFGASYSEAEEYQITFNTGGGEVNATISTQAVPEPASMAWLGAGMIGIGAIKRRSSATA
jgi:hypothetical protein